MQNSFNLHLLRTKRVQIYNQNSTSKKMKYFLAGLSSIKMIVFQMKKLKNYIFFGNKEHKIKKIFLQNFSVCKTDLFFKIYQIITKKKNNPTVNDIIMKH